MSAFGRDFRPSFWRRFGASEALGETTREKTRIQGEAFRGIDRFYARILCADHPQVRVCGSRSVFLSPRGAEMTKRETSGRKGELVRDATKGS